MKPSLSIIVPVYKVARFLENSLERIAHQTLKDIEVILVCDGDDDDMRICREFVRKDSRFSLKEYPKRGLGGARNDGLEAANADLILFLDADDLIDLNMCEEMIKPFKSNPDIDFTACGTEILFEGKEDPILKANDDKYFALEQEGLVKVTSGLFGNLNVGTWNKIYKKEILNKYHIRFPEFMLNEDAYFNWCYWSVSKSYWSFPKKYYHYIRRSDSLMGQTRDKSLGKKALDHLIIAEMFYDFLLKNSLFNKYKEGFWNTYLISFWFVRDCVTDEWKHKMNNLIEKFISHKELPNQSKFNEIRNIAKNSQKWPFFRTSKVYDENKPYITAILPIYKCEKYLARCIDSVIEQKLKNIEIILACDGGDECFKICEEYEAKDKRIKVIKNCGGYGKSVNKGIDLAQGTFISIIECDDWCDPEMFSELYRYAVQYDADVVKGGWFDAYDDTKKNVKRVFDYKDGFFNIYEHLEFMSSQPSVWSAIYRKDYLEKNHIYFMEKRQSFVDAPFHYQTLYSTEDYVLINKPLYYYYQDNPSQSVKNVDNKIFDGLDAEKYALTKICEIKGLWNSIGNGFLKAFVSHMNWNLQSISDLNKLSELKQELSKFCKSLNVSTKQLMSLEPHERTLFESMRLNDYTIKEIEKPLSDSGKTILRLFGFIPIFSIKKNNNILKFKLFGKINIFSVKFSNSLTRVCIFKFLPILVIRRK